MYVCICNALRDKEIKAVAGDNARTVAEVFNRCGSRPRCGKCLPDVAEMIENARSIETSANTIAAE